LKKEANVRRTNNQITHYPDNLQRGKFREAIKQNTPYPNIKNIENKNNLTTV